jgi:hypothetical protein
MLSFLLLCLVLISHAAKLCYASASARSVPRAFRSPRLFFRQDAVSLLVPGYLLTAGLSFAILHVSITEHPPGRSGRSFCPDSTSAELRYRDLRGRTGVSAEQAIDEPEQREQRATFVAQIKTAAVKTIQATPCCCCLQGVKQLRS